jgi:hypothetical protein
MRKSLQTLAITSALVAGFAMASPLLAAQTLAPPDTTKEPDMMGKGSDMMGKGSGMMGGDDKMKQMSQMMESCNKMMQTSMNGDHDGGKPNEQWHKDAPATPDK